MPMSTMLLRGKVHTSLTAPTRPDESKHFRMGGRQETLGQVSRCIAMSLSPPFHHLKA